MISGLRAWTGSTLLAGIIALSGCHAGRQHAGGTASHLPTASRWNVTFRDVASDAGIRFELGHDGKSPLSILETSPGGCAFVDLDLDGLLDIVLVGPQRYAVYRNLGTGHFEDNTPRMAAHPAGPWMGCTVGDYDNDGYPDLLLTGYRRCALLRNDHGRHLVEVTQTAGLASRLWTTSAAFSDVDADGWLDLYVGAYVDYRVGTKDTCLQGSVMTTCGPEDYGPERGHLYRNLRNGRFEDTTRVAGLDAATGKTWGVAFGDYDEDGKPDLYLANDQVAGNLFHNLGHGKFEDVGTSSGTAYDALGHVQGGMGVDWSDFDGDGHQDLFVSTYARQDKMLYRNEGAGSFRPVSAESGLAGPTHPYVAFGCGFLDADNDGYPDLFLVNGHVRANPEELDGTQKYRQPPQLFANGKNGTFEEVSSRAGGPFSDRLVGRGVAFGDYDNDGGMDVLAMDLEGHARLLHNEGGAGLGNWITLRLDGGLRNRLALGARITLDAGGRRQVREVTCGRSILSASDSRAHFGLGSAQKADRILVQWPDGASERWIDVPANRPSTLRRGSQLSK